MTGLLRRIQELEKQIMLSTEEAKYRKILADLILSRNPLDNLTLEMVTRIIKRDPQVRLVNYRATAVDEALLALVASRLGRSRSDTLRLLVRAAAAEMNETKVERLEGGGVA